MDEMQGIREMRPSRGLLVTVMLLCVTFVAGGASVMQGMEAGRLRENAVRQDALLSQEATKLVNAGKYIDGIMKQQEAIRAAERSGVHYRAEQMWTWTGGALIGISLLGFAFTWARRRAKTRA